MQPIRLPRPWDSPGKNNGVDCHFLLQCMKVKSKLKSLSRVQLLATPWTKAHQAPPSMGFSRQACWSGVPLPQDCISCTPVLLVMTGDRCKQTCKRDFIKDCFQGADLAERWDSSLHYFLPNCCLDFSCDGWNSCSCIGQSCNLGDR